MNENDLRELLNRAAHSTKDTMAASKLVQSAMLEFEARCLQDSSEGRVAAREKIHTSMDMLLDAIASNTAIGLSTLGERTRGEPARRDDRVWLPADSAEERGNRTIAIRLVNGVVHRGYVRVETVRRADTPGGFDKRVSFYLENGHPIDSRSVSGWDELRPGD